MVNDLYICYFGNVYHYKLDSIAFLKLWLMEYVTLVSLWSQTFTE